MTTVLVISRESAANAVYQRLLHAHGLTGVFAGDANSALEAMRTEPLQGVLIDVPTLLRLQGRGRQNVHDALDYYPQLRCRTASPEGTLTVFGHGTASKEDTILRFVAQCIARQGRTIRRHERYPITLCVLLGKEATLPPASTEKSVTLNLSTGGAFCFSLTAWPPGESLWLQFPNLTDLTAIKAEVVHISPWGEGCRPPGCGVEFLSITDTQRSEIRTIIAGSCLVRET